MNKDNKKIFEELNLYKFLFTIIICLHHLGTIEALKHGYLAVEFFFMVSGFLIYKTYKEKGLAPTEFIKNRFLKLYPAYFISMIVFFSFQVFKNMNNLQIIKESIIKLIPEIFVLQDIAFFGGGNNYPMWYMSVLLWGGLLIYIILYKYEYLLSNVLSPVVILLTYTFIFSKSNTIEIWTIESFISMPLLRGISDMLIGIIIYKIYNKIKALLITKKLSFIIKYLSLFLIFILLVKSRCLDKYSLLFIPLFILTVLCSNRKYKILNEFTKYSYHMFLVYAFVIDVFRTYITQSVLKTNILYTIMYLLVVYLCAVLLDIIINFIDKHILIKVYKYFQSGKKL